MDIEGNEDDLCPTDTRDKRRLTEVEKVFNLFALDNLSGKPIEICWGDLRNLLGAIYEIRRGSWMKEFKEWTYRERAYVIRAEVATVQAYCPRDGWYRVMRVYPKRREIEI